MGARAASATWVVAGKLWIFGGYGYGPTVGPGYLSDLWLFTPPSTMKFIGGATNLNQLATYPQRFYLMNVYILILIILLL